MLHRMNSAKEECYIERILQRKNATSNKCCNGRMLHRTNAATEECYIERMLQRKNATSKECCNGRMLHRMNAATEECYIERMLQQKNATSNECCKGRILHRMNAATEECYIERMLQRTVFINNIRILLRTRMKTIGWRNTRVSVTCRAFPLRLEHQSSCLLSFVRFSAHLYRCTVHFVE